MLKRYQISGSKIIESTDEKSPILVFVAPNESERRQLIDNYKIDGVVFHRAFTCRTIHVGQMHQINVLREFTDIPTLILEGDIVDIRYYNEVQTRSRIDAFIETVDAHKRG